MKFSLTKRFSSYTFIFMNTKNDIYEEAHNLFNRVMEHYRMFERASRDYGTGDTLSRAEIHAIAAVDELPLITVTALSEYLGVTKGASSQLIGKITKKGYINKLKSVDNDREILLALTEKGKAASQGHKDYHRALSDKFMKGISADHAEGFIEVLKKIEAFTVNFRDGKRPI